MNKGSIALVVLAGLLTFTAPAGADTTIKSDDASVEITVPNGWRQTKPMAPVINIQATNGRAVIFVRVVSKEDFKDLKSFAQVGSTRFTRNLTDAEPKFEDVEVNGHPAIRVSAEGTVTSGARRGFMMTFVDTGTMFVEVVGVANASAYKAEQQTMADMAGRVKVLTAAGAAAQPAPAPAPAPTQTPSASPSAGGKPPSARTPR
jgi:hypothetical protein